MKCFVVSKNYHTSASAKCAIYIMQKTFNPSAKFQIDSVCLQKIEVKMNDWMHKN